MADTKTSALAAASALAGTEVFPVVQGAETKKATAAQIATYVATTLGAAASLAADTDTTLAANSDGRVATQKATKAYVDQIVASQDAMVFKGVIDCSANPNYPAADRGWTYRASVAGKIGGGSGVVVQAGDIIICLNDSTAGGNQAAVGANWSVVQVNLDGALTAADIDIDAAMTANSDTRVPSQKAVKAAIAAASGAAAPGIPSLNLTNFRTSQFNAFRKKVGGMRAGTGARPVVMVSGDSTTRGYTSGAAGEYFHRPTRYMAKALIEAGVPATEQSHFGASTNTDDPDIVFGGSGWGYSNPGGVIGGAWVENSTTAAPITYTPDGFAWDRCEIHYVNFGNAVMNITIDGEAPTTGPSSYTPTGGTTQGRVIVGSAEAAVQSLTLTKAVAGDFAAVNGPIRFWNSAEPGIDIVCNGGGGYTAGYGSANGAFFVLDAVALAQPDINFINYGTNDWFGDTQTNYDNYQAQLTTIVTAIQAYGGQAILVAPPPVLAVSDAQTQNYLTAMRAVSVAKNCPMMSLYDRFDRSTASLSADWYNSVHGNKEMYADIGYAYAEVIKLIISG